MNIKERTSQELAIDEATAEDTLSDVELSSAQIIRPSKSKKIPLRLNIENEIIQLCRQIATIKHIDSVTQLIQKYIRDGVDKDRNLINKNGKKYS